MCLERARLDRLLNDSSFVFWSFASLELRIFESGYRFSDTPKSRLLKGRPTIAQRFSPRKSARNNAPEGRPISHATLFQGLSVEFHCFSHLFGG